MIDIASLRKEHGPSQAEFAAKLGVNQATVSRLEAGTLTPSRPLAIHIFRTTGWRHDRIAGLTDEQMEMLERIEPWTPSEATPDPTPDASSSARKGMAA